MERRKEGRWKEGRNGGREEGRKKGRMEGWKEGWKDGRMEGRKDGRTEGRKDGKNIACHLIPHINGTRRQSIRQQRRHRHARQPPVPGRPARHGGRTDENYVHLADQCWGREGRGHQPGVPHFISAILSYFSWLCLCACSPRKMTNIPEHITSQKFPITKTSIERAGESATL